MRHSAQRHSEPLGPCSFPFSLLSARSCSQALPLSAMMLLSTTRPVMGVFFSLIVRLSLAALHATRHARAQGRTQPGPMECTQQRSSALNDG